MITDTTMTSSKYISNFPGGQLLPLHNRAQKFFTPIENRWQKSTNCYSCSF